ncbi:hypothetical protein [Burkholderia sp. WSM2232]|uniref:hypothetical protein n=1 Tax=Burkholderia sp. WSM2232 TaxID=944436 RepID=UPI0004865605|nr:hypothetical protein [Burkholderia sp. WSM2232]
MELTVDALQNDSLPMLRLFIGAIASNEKTNFVGDLDSVVSLQVANQSAVGIFDSSGQIHAFSGFEVLLDGELAETRSCFVAPTLRGLGIQRLMHYARALMIISTCGQNCSVVSATKATSSFARRNLELLGFSDWPRPHDAVKATCRDCAMSVIDEQCCCRFYVSRPANVATLAARVGCGSPEIEEARKRGINISWGPVLSQLRQRVTSGKSGDRS